MKYSIVLLLFILTSCKEVSFQQPQPKDRKALHQVPKDLQGKYLTIQDNGELSKDTVIITANGYRFGYYEPAERAAGNDEYEVGVLSDTLVLKSYKGYYFLNVNEKPEWLLRVLKPEKSGDLVYMALEQKDVDFKSFLKRLSAEIRVDSVVLKEETLYQIDPTPNQLIDLIEKGYFSKTLLKKIK
ncbi:MAG: hypothetical protein ACOYXT_27735 [Bacteroidota bacterium]